MKMTQKHGSLNLDSLAEDAEIEVKQRSDMHEGHVMEIAHCGESAVVYATTRGIHVGVRVPIDQGTELFGQALDSDRAAMVLGHLTAGLQSTGLQAHLLAGEGGLEALMITAHACDEVDARAVKARVTEIAALKGPIGEALREKGGWLSARLRDAVTLRAFAVAEALKKAEAVIVPTFDLKARDEMMARSGQTTSRG